jgi:hypothetical protein
MRLSVAADAATVSVNAPPVAPVELKLLDAVASATDKGGHPGRRYASIGGAAARGARGPRPRLAESAAGVSIVPQGRGRGRVLEEDTDPVTC